MNNISEIKIQFKQQPPKKNNQPPQINLSNTYLHMQYNWFARIFFIHVFSILKKLYDYNKELTLEQCPKIQIQEGMQTKLRQFQTNIIRIASQNKEETNINDLVFKSILSLFVCFKKQVFIFSTLILIQNISRLSIPFILAQLLKYEQGVDYFFFILLIILLILGLLLRHNNFLYAQEVSLKIRIILLETLYNKISTLNSKAIKFLNIQRINTFLSNNMENIQIKFQYLMLVITTPLILIYAISMLIIWNGFEGIIGFIYFVSMFFINYMVNIKLQSINHQQKKIKQQRRKIFQQSIQGIRTLKIYTWENFFSGTINKLKSKQTQILNKKFIFQCLQRAFSFSSSIIASTITFVSTYYIEGQLQIPQVFATLQLFMFMRINVMYFSQLGIQHYSQLKQMFQTFLEFMRIEQKNMTNDKLESPLPVGPNSPYPIFLKNVSLYWTDKVIIHNINLKIIKGKKYFLSGAIGQGKSTFFKFLIKQLPYYQGYAQITNKLAYIEQQPFLLSGTIKQNILFGRQCKTREQQNRYKEILQASCLIEDLQSFQRYDETMIQQDGINLSGGQKSRIVLARALYSEKQVYLFDDILNAIDSKVSNIILSRIIHGILKKSTIIFITNNQNHKKYFDYILKLVTVNQITEINLQQNKQFEEISFNQEDKFQYNQLKAKKLPLQTAKVTQNKTYLSYIKYAHICSWILCLFFFVICEILFSTYIHNIAYLFVPDNWDVNWKFTIVIAFILYFIYLIKYSYLIKVILKINQSLHNQVYEILLKSKLNFFQSHEKSEIISRFGADINTLDNIFPTIVCDSVQAPLYFTNLLITICLKIYWFAIFIPILIFLLIFFYKKCSPFMKKTKGLDIKSKNILQDSFKLILKGNLQIKLFNRQQYFLRQFKKKIQNYSRVNLLYWSIQRGFSFLMQAITLMFSFIAIFLTYFINWDQSHNAQTLIYAIALSDYIQLGIRQISLLDSLMLSAQRLLKFLQNPLEQQHQRKQNKEIPINVLENSINMMKQIQNLQNWPNKGKFEFKNVSLVYSNGKKALNNISFVCEQGKKIGCIGRTGSGKTSILNALFRFQEISQGQIILDGINTKLISLNKLRNSFSVIPQIPFVFDGSIRKNIDPFDEYLREQICEVLKQIKLQKFIPKLDNRNIHLTLSEKQLLCFGRCLLKKSKTKILILDEATSSIDNQTDEIIQQLILKNFNKCSVFSIAHRIRTISDSEYLIEMRDGEMQKVQIYNHYRDYIKKAIMIEQ